ncbi:MAG: hypothetical protein V3T33_11140 [Myxococcota bacterium]
MRFIPHREMASREQGSALLIAMLLLVMMGMSGLAALDTVTRDRQVAGFQSRQRMAFYAAEAAVASALTQLEATGTPAVVNTDVGTAGIYPHGQPAFQLDPTVPVTEAIELIGVRTIDGFDIGIGASGGATYQMQFWKIRVQGTSPGGSVSRLEVAAGKFVGS